MNPNTAKGRRLHAASMLNAVSGTSGAGSDAKSTAAFLTMDKQSNLIPRMGPVKHELYFPQCYGPPFNQAFGNQQQAHSNSAGGTTTTAPAGPAVPSVPPGAQ